MILGTWLRTLPSVKGDGRVVREQKIGSSSSISLLTAAECVRTLVWLSCWRRVVERRACRSCRAGRRVSFFRVSPFPHFLLTSSPPLPVLRSHLLPGFPTSPSCPALQSYHPLAQFVGQFVGRFRRWFVDPLPSFPAPQFPSPPLPPLARLSAFPLLPGPSVSHSPMQILSEMLVDGLALCDRMILPLLLSSSLPPVVVVGGDDVVTPGNVPPRTNTTAAPPARKGYHHPPPRRQLASISDDLSFR